MLKKIARKEYLAKRKNLTREEIAEKTIAVVNHFIEMKLPPVQFLLSHSPIVERNEFDVSLCECVIKEKYPLVTIGLPKIDQDKFSMQVYIVDTKDSLVKNELGMLEPANGESIEPTLMDMVFVPLLAFDRRGYRIGYGKGFYDRFLLQCRPDAVKFGFSFFEAVDEIKDINEFDVPLNFCITPSRIYEF
jgi:5-formyltetrahydrofolate cyclo-ligase